jgi:hypothetical protein
LQDGEDRTRISRKHRFDWDMGRGDNESRYYRQALRQTYGIRETLGYLVGLIDQKVCGVKA